MNSKLLQSGLLAALLAATTLGYAQQQMTGAPEPTPQQNQKADLKADETQAKLNEKTAKAQAKASKAEAKSDKAQRKSMKENEKASQTSADSRAAQTPTPPMQTAPAQ